MGDRYYLTVECPKCGYTEQDVYYAPTCYIDRHTCMGCGHTIDLAEYSGISYEDASNIDIIRDLCKNAA